MQAAAMNKATTSSPKAVNSPNRNYLPPLMATLDSFVESGSDDRALDMLEAVKPNLGGGGGGIGGGTGGLKKKTKKIKKKGTKKLTSADTNQLPDPRGVPNSPRMIGGPLQNSYNNNNNNKNQPHYSNNNNNYEQQRSQSPTSPHRKRKGQGGSHSDTEDNSNNYGFNYSSNMNDSSQMANPYHYPTTPIGDERKSQAAPRSAPRSAPRAGRTYKSVSETPDFGGSPTAFAVANGNFSFNKAIESIAALKLHNYAMRRRQNMSQKLKLMKEIKSLEKDNNSEMINQQKQRTNETIAAWKIRYYIEYLRLISTQHIVNVVEEKNQELEQECSKLKLQVTSVNHALEDQKILQERTEMVIETINHEKRDLSRIIENLQIDLESTKQEVLRKCEQLAQASQHIQVEKNIQKEDLARLEVIKSELNITRLTCQEMVKNNAHKDQLLDEMELKMKTLQGLVEAQQQEMQAMKESHQQEINKLREEKRDLEGKLDEKYAMEEEITSRDYTISSLQDMMKDLEKTIEEQNETMTKLSKQIQEEVKLREQETESAIHEKDSLQRVMTDLAIQLKACQEELGIQLEKVQEQETVTQGLQGDITSKESVIQELEVAIEEANHEIDFLVTENEELAREIECYTMKNEENEEKYRLLTINHQRGLEYRTYLEEELYQARHTASSNAHQMQMMMYNPGLSTTSGLSIGQQQGMMTAGGVGDVPDTASSSVFRPGTSMSSAFGGSMDDPFAFARGDLASQQGGIGLRMASFSAGTPEQKLVSIVSILEEKMNSMDKAANALQLMMEKAESLEKAQANRRHTLQLQKLQHQQQPSQEDGGSKSSSPKAADGLPITNESTASTNVGPDGEDAEAQALAKAKEDQEAAYAAQKQRRDEFLNEYNQMEEAYIEIQASIEEINKELAKQREDIKTLQDLRNKFKQDINLWKKNFKKVNKREATEEEKEKELSEYMTQMNLIRDQINAYKTSNLTLNAKAIALQTELNHLEIELEESNKEFKTLFHDLDITEFSLRHLKLKKDKEGGDGEGEVDDMGANTDLDAIIGGVASRPSTTLTTRGSVGSSSSARAGSALPNDVPEEEGLEDTTPPATAASAVATTIPNDEELADKPEEKPKDTDTAAGTVATVDFIFPIAEVPDEDQRPSTARTDASNEKRLSGKDLPTTTTTAPSTNEPEKKDVVVTEPKPTVADVAKADSLITVAVVAPVVAAAAAVVVSSAEPKSEGVKDDKPADIAAVTTAATAVLPSNDLGEDSMESQTEDEGTSIKASTKSSKSKSSKSKSKKDKSKKKSKKSPAAGDETSDYESNAEDANAAGQAIRSKMTLPSNDEALEKSDSMSTISVDPGMKRFSPEASTSLMEGGSSVIEGEPSLDNLAGGSIEEVQQGSDTEKIVPLSTKSKSSKSKSKKGKDLTVSLDSNSIDQSEADGEQSDASPSKKVKKLKKKSKSKSSRNASDLISNDDAGQASDVDAATGGDKLGIEPGSSLDQGSLYNNYQMTNGDGGVGGELNMTEEEMMMNMMMQQGGYMSPQLASIMAMKSSNAGGILSKPGSPGPQQPVMTFDPLTGTWYTTPSHPSSMMHVAPGQPHPSSPGQVAAPMTGPGAISAMAASFFPNHHPMMYNPYDPRFYGMGMGGMPGMNMMGMPGMGMNPFYPYGPNAMNGMQPGGFNPYMPYGAQNMMGMMGGGVVGMGGHGVGEGDGGSLDGGVAVSGLGQDGDNGSSVEGIPLTLHPVHTNNVAPTNTEATIPTVLEPSTATTNNISSTVDATATSAAVAPSSLEQLPPQQQDSLVFSTPVRPSAVPAFATAAITPAQSQTSPRVPSRQKAQQQKGLQSASHQQRSHLHQLHQQVRLKLAKIKGEMETLYAEVNDVVEEIEGLEVTRADVKQEILTWHMQFYDVNGYLAEELDKTRSKVYPTLQKAFLDTQEVLEKKYAVAIPALQKAQSKLDELMAMQEEVRSLSSSLSQSSAATTVPSSTMKVEELNYRELYKLPQSFEYRYEDPNLIAYDPDAIDESGEGDVGKEGGDNYDALTAAMNQVSVVSAPTAAPGSAGGDGIEDAEPIGPLMQGGSVKLTGSRVQSASPSRKGSGSNTPVFGIGGRPSSRDARDASRKGSASSVVSDHVGNNGKTLYTTPVKGGSTPIEGSTPPTTTVATPTSSSATAATNEPKPPEKIWRPPSKPGLHNSEVLIPDMAAYWGGFDVVPNSTDSQDAYGPNSVNPSQSQSRDVGLGSTEPSVYVVGPASIPTSRAMTPGSMRAATAPLSPIADDLEQASLVKGGSHDGEQDDKVGMAMQPATESPVTVQVRRKYSEAFTSSLLSNISALPAFGVAMKAKNNNKENEKKKEDIVEEPRPLSIEALSAAAGVPFVNIVPKIAGPVTSAPAAVTTSTSPASSAVPAPSKPTEDDDLDYSFLDNEVLDTKDKEVVPSQVTATTTTTPQASGTPAPTPAPSASASTPALPAVSRGQSQKLTVMTPEPSSPTVAPAPSSSSPAQTSPVPASVINPAITTPVAKPSRKNRAKNNNDDYSSASESESGTSYGYGYGAGSTNTATKSGVSEIVDPSLFTDMSSSPAVTAAIAKQTSFNTSYPPLNSKQPSSALSTTTGGGADDEEESEGGDKLVPLGSPVLLGKKTASFSANPVQSPQQQRDPKKTVYGHLTDYDLFKEDPAAAMAAAAAAANNKAVASPAAAPVSIGVTLHDLVGVSSSNLARDTASAGSSTSRLGSANNSAGVNKRSVGRSVSFHDPSNEQSQQPAPTSSASQQQQSQPAPSLSQSPSKTPSQSQIVASGMVQTPVVVKPSSPNGIVNRVNSGLDAVAANSTPIMARPPASPTAVAPSTPSTVTAAVAPAADAPMTPSEMIAAAEARNKAGSRPGSRSGNSRPTTADGLLNAEYNQLKKDLKKWKAEFVAANGREPTVADFNDLDHTLKVKIARKNQLKKILGDSGGGGGASSMSSRKSKRPSTTASAVGGTDTINEEL